MDALGGVVGNQLRGGVVGVQFDLVDSRDDLAAGVVQELLEVLDAEVGDTNVTNLAGGRKLLHLLPERGQQQSNYSNQEGLYQVLMKSQSGRCFFRSLGSVLLGQWTR